MMLLVCSFNVSSASWLHFHDPVILKPCTVVRGCVDGYSLVVTAFVVEMDRIKIVKEDPTTDITLGVS